MNDQDFVEAFFSGLMLSRQGREIGARKVTDGIRLFAAAYGHSFRYHETMTQFWIWLVDHVRTAQPQIKSFDEFLSAFPAALAQGAPLSTLEP